MQLSVGSKPCSVNSSSLISLTPLVTVDPNARNTRFLSREIQIPCPILIANSNLSDNRGERVVRRRFRGFCGFRENETPTLGYYSLNVTVDDSEER
jgi:hypothetical protein